jgi:ERF superfamily
MQTSEQIAELAAALATAQAAMRGALKDSENPFFRSKYADLASVWEACREPLTANHLAIVQFPRASFEGKPEPYEWTTRSGEVRYGVRVMTVVSVVTRLVHSSGQWLEDTASTMLSTGDPQAVGSAITYLRRYALAAVAGVAPEDDDAEAATTTRAAQAVPRQSTQSTQAPAARLSESLPPGPVGIVKVQTQATKNPAVQRHSITLTDGRLVTTINEWLGALAVEAQRGEVPVYVKTKETKYGVELVTMTRADQETPEPPLTSEDIPF